MARTPDASDVIDATSTGLRCGRGYRDLARSGRRAAAAQAGARDRRGVNDQGAAAPGGGLRLPAHAGPGRRDPVRLGLGPETGTMSSSRRSSTGPPGSASPSATTATSRTARSRPSPACGWRSRSRAASRWRVRSSRGWPTTGGTTSTATRRATRTRLEVRQRREGARQGPAVGAHHVAVRPETRPRRRSSRPTCWPTGRSGS